MAFANPKLLLDLVQRHKGGDPVGIYSVCSANPLVIQASMKQALKDDSYLLVEATCNQVNQFGGYSGWTPLDFAQMIRQVCNEMGFAEERLLLGGDHLGPFPWQKLPVEQAMANAAGMIQAYVAAGFGKVHLDASMPCADEPQERALDPAVIAERSAYLCRIAEDAAARGSVLPVYVIGTDIPTPGGVQDAESTLQITLPPDLQASLDAFHTIFNRQGLSGALERVAAVVVQPGVEFGDEGVAQYDRTAAAGLTRFIEGQSGLVYEAHSTDYQRAASLRELVEDHFAILKVGPALTFALREALFSLARIEAEYLGARTGVQLSHLIETMDAAMLRNPMYWSSYYHGETDEIAFARKYSRSDRIRYYWSDGEVAAALQRLLANLEQYPAPLTLVSQYLPAQYQRLRAGELDHRPTALIHDHIMSVLRDYSAACRSATLNF